MLREAKEEGGKGVSPEDWINQKIQAGEIIPGFGRRVYETMDSRGEELKKLAQKLDQEKGNDWCSLSRKIKKAVKKR